MRWPADLYLVVLPGEFGETEPEADHKVKACTVRPKRQQRMPVSYTHLDVYKRQLYTIRRNSLALPGPTGADKVRRMSGRRRLC